MGKLLAANFARLKKDKIFWICMGVMLLYAVVYMLNGCRQATADLSDYSYGLDQYYFHFAASIGLFCALFSSMFFGTEYGDGTIRNKIIIGHARQSVYLANFLTAFTAALCMMLVWLIGALVAVPVLGFWKMSAPNVILYLLIGVMLLAALCSICTFVSMLSVNKAMTVALSILLVLGLIAFASMVYGSLQEPEMSSGVSITANGMEMSDLGPNPNYITGVKREIYEWLIDFLPTGQGLRMWQLEINRPVRMLVSSAFITLFTTLGGIFLFKRKNLQ